MVDEERAMEHESWLLAIELALDNELSAAEQKELTLHLAGCADCRSEAERSERAVTRLAAERISPRPGFVDQVMAALEPATWEARSPRSWRLPVALLAALAVASAALFASGAAALRPSGGAAEVAAALFELFRAALAAGSGLANASWRGVGDAVGEWLRGSPGNWTAGLVLAVATYYLLFRLLTARRRPVALAERRGPRA